MFEKATRQKLRFNYKGSATVEDLWDIPLKDLNNLFKGYNAELSEQKGESLLEVKNSNSSVLELQIGTIKHVVKVRLQEKKDRHDLKANKERKQKLLGIIANKQDTELEGKSVEEINKMIDDL